MQDRKGLRMEKRNMSLEKVKMPEQDPDVRNKNFDEVALGYTPEMAMEEAQRCLHCKNKPCVGGCPVNVPIPEFIEKVAAGDFEAAYQVITRENALPAICGRVCPQEDQCEGRCVRGIKGEPVGIGRMERFVADYHMAKGDTTVPEIEKNGIKVAVIGCGPSGITCAGELARKGYDVTVFEALHKPGGVLSYGIPEFRLPKALVAKEIENVEKLGVDIETNVIVGKSITIDDLMSDGYKAVFIGSGAGLPKFLNIPGENLLGVYSANEFLTRVNLMKAFKFPETPTPVKIGKKVAVVGAGNVAMDAARTAKRLGAEEVYIVYRRSEEECPARLEEVHHAKEEGIIFKFLNNPCKILGDENGYVTGMEVVKQELGEPDASGRRRPIPIEGSNYVMDVDSVIISVGTSPNPLLRTTTPGLDTQKWGGIIVDEATMETSKEYVYAGGDAVTGAATVILAMGAGKTAAAAIDEKLKAQN
jgi:glutamate synthase (NADPH/NADH) small chain